MGVTFTSTGTSVVDPGYNNENYDFLNTTD